MGSQNNANQHTSLYDFEFSVSYEFSVREMTTTNTHDMNRLEIRIEITA